VAAPRAAEARRRAARVRLKLGPARGASGAAGGTHHTLLPLVSRAEPSVPRHTANQASRVAHYEGPALRALRNTRCAPARDAPNPVPR
jgi:hypothetical protein